MNKDMFVCVVKTKGIKKMKKNEPFQKKNRIKYCPNCQEYVIFFLDKEGMGLCPYCNVCLWSSR